MTWYCYSALLLFLLYKAGVQGFFIKHQSSGSCLIARTEVKAGTPGVKWGALYFMDLQNRCLDKRAQFRFLNTGAIRNGDAKGCISARLKGFVDLKIVLFLYQPTDRTKYAVCGSGSALVQTKGGGLLDRDFYEQYHFKVKSNLCAKPLQQSWLTTKYGAHLTELVYTCDQEDQIFNFGSVTCDGDNMVDVNCPPNQVMIIKNAFYGGSSKIKACGYDETSSCTLDATCALKHICDGLESCNANVNSSLVDHDPCPGKKKYLYFEYQCLNKSDSVKTVNVCKKQILKDKLKIPDSWFTSSSREAGQEAYKSRFTSGASWCAGCEQDAYLQIDLGKQYFVKKVTTLGDNNTGSWVGTYKLNYTIDFKVWTEASVTAGEKEFPGNDVRLGDGKIIRLNITPRAVRFIPVFFYKKACMRVEMCGKAVLPDKPANLRITKSSRNATFSWTAPVDGGDGGVTYYVIKITADVNVIQRYAVVETSTSSTATKLVPNTDYKMSIAARNQHGLSNEAYLEFTTKEDAPDGPPLDVTIIALNSSSLNVSWREPEKRKRNGAITQYGVCVSFQETDACDKTFTTEDNMLIVGDLDPSTLYYVKVRACTKVGCGPYSNYTERRTNIEPLQPPKNSTSTTLTFVLRKPTVPFSFYLVVVLKLEGEVIPERPTSSYGDEEFKTYSESRSSNEQLLYIAANLTGDVKNTFVLGSGESNSQQNERKRRSTAGQYYNGPLEAGRYYSIFQRFYFEGGHFSTDWSAPAKTKSTLVDTTGPTEPRSIDDDNTNDKTTVVIIIVCVVAVIVLILAALAIAFFRRRNRGKREQNPSLVMSTAAAHEATRDDAGNSASDDDEANDDGDDEGEDDDDRGDARESVGLGERQTGGAFDGIYGNQEEIILQKTHEDIPIEQLEEHIREMKEGSFFKKEFEELPFGKRYRWDISKKSFNKDKNRYGNIATYDHSRVQLSGGEETNYINASYVDGITENYYIATQGPKPLTINDFWRLIFEHKCPTIIMLTTLVEMGKVKCEKYWPEESKMYGHIKVTNTETKAYADHLTRSFSLEKGGERHSAKQFHFISWPDHGVPRYPTQFLTFRSHFQAYHQSQTGAAVVHCSAGVGRTGVFIAIDKMIDDLDKNNVETLNIFDVITYMRTRRINMVQVLEQYIFIHDTLLDYIKCGANEIDPENLVIEMKKLSQTNEHGMTGFEEKFKSLNEVSPLLIQEECDAALSERNKSKNRSPSIYPAEIFRVNLPMVNGDQSSDYINACFVDGYLGKNFFIATQTPLDETINDFWRMVVEKNSSTIVMLNQLREDQQDYPMFWPLDKSETRSYGSVNVTFDSAERDRNIVTRKFVISSFLDDSKSRTVRMLQFIAWPDHGVPKDGEEMLALFSQVERSQRAADKGPIVVMCSDGAGRTGTYIAISNLVDRVKAVQLIDVFQAIKLIRGARPQFVENKVQYEFCHTVIDALLKSFTGYSNFDDAFKN